MTAEVIPFPDYDRQVGRRVKLAIFDSGKTQTEVAIAAGINPPSMTLRMQGKRPWRAEEIVRIAAATGVEVTDLLPRLDSNQQPFGYARDYRSAYLDGTCQRCGRASAVDVDGLCWVCGEGVVDDVVVDLAAYRRRAS